MKPFFLFLSICILSSGNTWAQDCFGTSCLPQQVQDDCTTMESNGCIDWAKGIIYATGMGVPNPKFPTQAQKSYSAYQAARVVAMRNLLQVVEGINITSTRTVKSGMLEDDTIQTQISGKIRGVQEAGRPQTMNDGSVWVTMKMYMRDIVAILVNNQKFGSGSAVSQMQQPGKSLQQPRVPAAPAPSAPSGPQYGGQASTIYSGLIIDARGSGVTPAMSPKIFDPTGKEVYGSAAVGRDFVLQHGIVGYVKDLQRAKSNERIQGNPLLIKGTTNSGQTSDLVISQEDADLLRKLDASQTFLREARVMVIIG